MKENPSDGSSTALIHLVLSVHGGNGEYYLSYMAGGRVLNLLEGA